MQLLRIEKSTMQNLLHSKGFPSYRIGRIWRVNEIKLL